MLASDKRFKDGVTKPYTVLMQKAKEMKPKQQEEEDFYAILKNRVENRRKGGDPA